MKTLLMTLALSLSSASVFACEAMPESYQNLWTIQRSLSSDAFQEEFDKLASTHDMRVTEVTTAGDEAMVYLSINCVIKVKTEWTETDGGGACPEVKEITAKTHCWKL